MATPVFTQEEDRNVPPLKAEMETKKTETLTESNEDSEIAEIQDEDSSDDNWIHLLEILNSYAPSENRGPRTAAGILNSMRLSRGFVGGKTEYHVITGRRDSGESIPRLQYTWGSLFSTSVYLASGRDLVYEQKYASPNNSYITDRITTNLTQTGIRFGISPLGSYNPVTDSITLRISVGYERLNSSGPYRYENYKIPTEETEETPSDNILGAALGGGSLRYGVNNYNLSAESAFDLSWLLFGLPVNYYFNFTMNYIAGHMGMQSIAGIYTLEGEDPDFIVAEESLDYQGVSVRAELFGFIYNFEQGLIFRLSSSMGLKIGYYFQMSVVDITGVYGMEYVDNQIIINDNGTPLNLDKSENTDVETSAAKGKILSSQTMGKESPYNGGIVFGFVTSF